MPTVSVVIPAYNASTFLAESLESVLGQTFRDIELVVVDDGSEDDTPSVLDRYRERLRSIRQPNRGVAAARNTGIQASQGEFVAFLDADDRWQPEKLAVQVAALRASPDSRACSTAFTIADSAMRPVEVRRPASPSPELVDLLLHGNVIGTPSTVICDRTLLLETGGFDPTLSQCADWDLWIRLCTRTRFVCLDESLVVYRRHDGNMSRSVGLLAGDSSRVLEKAFAMRELPEDLRRTRRRAFAQNDMVLSGAFFRAGSPVVAARRALSAVRGDWRLIRYLLEYPLRARARQETAKGWHRA